MINRAQRRGKQKKRRKGEIEEGRKREKGERREEKPSTSLILAQVAIQEGKERRERKDMAWWIWISSNFVPEALSAALK